ncbi:generative cell specific-1 [Trypanosoma grayi]|uniref:generative cell specific-1 n=1 Tax=Trypanosoma grayi TaxID=71804 RepID=UPI0004F448FD|nr:generative cell specific-1 [Trypanosoma grayi]KEG14722.1 generative cell specific-1 [Trypanosoma grayi]
MHSLSALIIAVLAAQTVITLPFGVRATLVASSSIEYCERGSSVDPIPCEKKMVVTLTVDSGQAAGVEEVVFVRDAMDKTKGAGDNRVQFLPIRMTTRKSQVQYRYPVFYERNFNAKPYEEQIMTDVFQGCSDAFDLMATCGLVMDSNGNTIPYSQGFCCTCGICQMAGLCPPDSRGVQTCNLFGKSGAASCLRFGDLWYAGYTVGSGASWYRVYVTVSSGEENDTEQNKTTLELGPDVLADSSPEFGAWGRLVGDFVPPTTPLDLSGKMLFVPTFPRWHQRVLAGAKEWMLLDKDLVTVQGRDCNKVGVSYEAFSSQGSKCSLQKGSCLADQLEDYRERDLAQETAGGRGRYMARFLGDFDFSGGNTSTKPYVSYWMRGSLATMITLTISADRLQYLLSVSSGKIISTRVLKDKIDASTRDGVVEVTVRNTGTETAQYTLSLVDCTEGIHPMIAQTVSMRPSEDATRRFDLLVQDTTAEGTMQCSVTLRNAKGDVVDTKIVEFLVTATGWTNGTQGGSAPDGAGIAVESSGQSACSRCAWYNLLCFLRNSCWWQPLVFVMIAVAVLLIAYVVRSMRLCRGGTSKLHVEASEPVMMPQVIVHHGVSPQSSIMHAPH